MDYFGDERKIKICYWCRVLSIAIYGGVWMVSDDVDKRKLYKMFLGRFDRYEFWSIRRIGRWMEFPFILYAQR